MSVSLRTIRLCHASCGRLGCSTFISFEATSEATALTELRQRGWAHDGEFTRCPAHRPEKASA